MQECTGSDGRTGIFQGLDSPVAVLFSRQVHVLPV